MVAASHRHPRGKKPRDPGAGAAQAIVFYFTVVPTVVNIVLLLATSLLLTLVDLIWSLLLLHVVWQVQAKKVSIGKVVWIELVFGLSIYTWVAQCDCADPMLYITTFYIPQASPIFAVPSLLALGTLAVVARAGRRGNLSKNLARSFAVSLAAEAVLLVAITLPKALSGFQMQLVWGMFFVVYVIPGCLFTTFLFRRLGGQDNRRDHDAVDLSVL